MSTWFDRAPLAGLDFETTHRDPLQALPVSAAVVLSQGPEHAPAPGHPMLVNPGVSSTAEAVAIHGIRPDYARAYGRDLGEALESTVNALLGACERGYGIVGANVRYDLTVLDHGCRRLGVPTLHQRAERAGWPVWALDPMLIDRWWDRYRRGPRNLGALCAHYGVELREAHQAHADAVAAVQLLRVLMRQVADEDGTLGRLASGVWEGARWLELRRCRSVGELSALLGRWHAGRARDYQAWRRRSEPDYVEPVEWPVLPRAA